MKIIVDLDAATHKKLQVLAKMRQKEPAHLAADLVAQVLGKQMASIEEQVANTPDIAEVLAARMLATDPTGACVKNALAELRMLDDTAHTRVVIARLQEALRRSGVYKSGD